MDKDFASQRIEEEESRKETEVIFEEFLWDGRKHASLSRLCKSVCVKLSFFGS